MITDTPADAASARQAQQERLWQEVDTAFNALNSRCNELIAALDADDGSRSGRAQLAATSPETFRSIYDRWPRTGFRRWLLGP